LTTRDQVKIPQLGDKAPDFTLEAIDGRNISLSDFRGRQVLLVFDMVRCPASIKQLPYIKAVYNQANGNLIVLFLYNNGLNLVSDYVVDNQLTTFPALLDPEGKVANSYGSGHLVPVSFFIDTKGIIRIKKIGNFESQEEIENILKSF
jgi:peroxiredoxin